MRIFTLFIMLFFLSIFTYSQQKAYIYFGDVNSINGDTIDVQIVLDNQTSSDLKGFQFDLTNISSIISIYGGSSQVFNSNTFGGPPNNTVLGFDFGMNFIPPDSSVLINVVYKDSLGACIENVVFSDPNGVAILDSISIPCLNTSHCSETSSIVDTSVCQSYLSPSGVTYTSSGTYADTITNVSGCDSVITIKLMVQGSSTHTITNISACTSYSWNGNAYTTSGTYVDTFLNAAGCDSVVTLMLTINDLTSSTTSISVCDSVVWNGMTYDTSGTYYSYLTNAAGCDSIAILNLTISSPTASTTNITSCNSYTWNGVTYTVSGTYTYDTINSSGCLHTDSLLLNISGASSMISMAVCDSFEWNGTTYYADGMYTSTSGSCADTLDLTILRPSTSADTMHTCDSISWNGITYSSSGTYNYYTTNSSGCDSVVTLYLTIDSSYFSSEVIHSCEEYLWNGVSYSQSGTYYDTTATASGCDSISVLVLSIDSLEAMVSVYNDSLISMNYGFGPYTYQWLDCKDMSAISGETNQIFVAPATGSYAVVVTNSSCIDTSDCYSVIIVSLFDTNPSTFRVYPNPTSGALIVEGEISSVELYDISGKRVVRSNDNSLQLNGLSDGVYIINVLDKLGNMYKYKVLKE